MLHGEIKVNDNEIATWQAVRVGRVDDENSRTHFVYRCEVHFRDMSGHLRMTGKFLVTHEFYDGALILASKVLQEGNRKLET